MFNYSQFGNVKRASFRGRKAKTGTPNLQESSGPYGGRDRGPPWRPHWDPCETSRPGAAQSPWEQPSPHPVPSCCQLWVSDEKPWPVASSEMIPDVVMFKEHKHNVFQELPPKLQARHSSSVCASCLAWLSEDKTRKSVCMLGRM